MKDAIEVVCRKLEQYEGWFTCIKPSTIEMVKILLGQVNWVCDQLPDSRGSGRELFFNTYV